MVSFRLFVRYLLTVSPYTGCLFGTLIFEGERRSDFYGMIRGAAESHARGSNQSKGGEVMRTWQRWPVFVLPILMVVAFSPATSHSRVAGFVGGKGYGAIWGEDDEVGALNMVKGATASSALRPIAVI